MSTADLQSCTRIDMQPGIALVQKPRHCLCVCHFAVSRFRPRFSSPLFFTFAFAPPNPSEVAAISAKVNKSQHASTKHILLVLCHRVPAFISSCSDFSWSLAVWCWYCWWCCGCVDECSLMVLISRHTLDEHSPMICSSTPTSPGRNHP